MIHKVNVIKRKAYSEEDSEEERDGIQIGHHYVVKRRENEYGIFLYILSCFGGICQSLESVLDE